MTSTYSLLVECPYAQRLRRLTPEEYEALQGFPRGWTALPHSSHYQRYKALGNAMPVPIMAYLGRRIQALSNE